MTKKVLIVDDEEEIVAFMGRFLKRLNIDSVLSLSGEDALEQYKKDSFDCVFLDIHLGGINGVEVLKQIKSMNSDAKVIIITGSISSNSKDDLIALGATDYIQKPIDLADFKEKISSYI